MKGLRFGSVVKMAIIIGGDADSETPKVIARVKDFQRNGCLPHVNTGRGIEAYYSLEAVWTAAIFLELHRLGIKRQEAAKLLGSATNWYAANVKERKPISFSLPDRRTQITIDVEWLESVIAPIWAASVPADGFGQEKRSRDIIDVRSEKRVRKLGGLRG